jgi:hypothetical protein
MSLVLELTPQTGDQIRDVASEMVRIARSLDVRVKLEFNGLLLHADAETDPESIIMKCTDEAWRRIGAGMKDGSIPA